MKKVILILEVVFIVLALSACKWPYSLQSITTDEYAESDKIVQEVITAIENKDEQALTKLFSKRALADSDGFEEGVSYTFDLYQGECLTIGDGTCVVTNHYGAPGAGMWIDSRYRFTTTEGEYWLYFEYVLIDGSNSDAEGLYSLWLYDDETVQRKKNELVDKYDFAKGIFPYHAGIYHPGWDGKYERGWQYPAPWKDQ